jgi:hypothetical protein
MDEDGRALGVAFPPMEVRRDVLVRSDGRFVLGLGLSTR